MSTYLLASPDEVHTMLKASGEIAMLDVREQGEFSRAHTLLASCAPLSRIEMLVTDLVPCRKTRVVVMDAGGDDDRAVIAAGVLLAAGYETVVVMAGGMDAWTRAGLVVVEGVGSLSKGFGEYVEMHCGTPRLDPLAVRELLDSGRRAVVIDVRPQDEYVRMNIPGSVNLPGCEVTYRFADVVGGPDDVVIVNCAGRTRSIIGTQTLINAGIPNKVFALKGGTMNWRLAGLQLEYGACRRTAPPSPAAYDVARRRAADVAVRYGVRFVDAETLRSWEAETGERTLYLFDIRLPDEYAAGHLPGSRNAQGGQLVQATDEYAAVRNGRFVLIDDTEVRAIMTAHWLIQMGLPEVYVLRGGLGGSGFGAIGLVESEDPASITPCCFDAVSCLDLATWNDATVIDVGSSAMYAKRHVPGACWCARAFLRKAKASLPVPSRLVLTSEDEYHAALAAGDAARLWPGVPVFSLTGGTTGWEAAGLPMEDGMSRTLCSVVDVWYRPYTDVNATPEAMRGYFDWESGLVDRITTDGCVQFHI